MKTMQLAGLMIALLLCYSAAEEKVGRLSLLLKLAKRWADSPFYQSSQKGGQTLPLPKLA
jgi:hypothetical protein